MSLRGIARELNRRGIRTPRGNQWLASSVSELLARIGGRGAYEAPLVRGTRREARRR
jgi:Recombinase